MIKTDDVTIVSMHNAHVGYMTQWGNLMDFLVFLFSFLSSLLFFSCDCCWIRSMSLWGRSFLEGPDWKLCDREN